MSGLLQDLRIAIRGLRQKPGLALLAILILALGSGATTIMFTVVSGVVLKPLAYPDSDRLVAVHVQADKFGDVWGFSYPDFLDCRRDCRSFEGITAWGYSGGTVSAPGEPEYVTGRRVSSELFSVLRIQLVRGRSFEEEVAKRTRLSELRPRDSNWMATPMCLRPLGRPTNPGCSGEPPASFTL